MEKAMVETKKVMVETEKAMVETEKAMVETEIVETTAKSGNIAERKEEYAEMSRVMTYAYRQ